MPLSFATQREQLQFDTANLPQLASQLEDVKHLCLTLFSAEISELISVQRAMVSSNDQASSYTTDYLPPPERKLKTNDAPAMLISPYEVSFKCISDQLARVLVKLAQSPDGFNIKWIKVFPTDGEVVEGEAAENAAPVGRYGMSAAMQRRYGMGMGRRGPAPVAAAPTEPGAPSNKKTRFMLEDKPFKAVITLDSIKYLPKLATPVSRTATNEVSSTQPPVQ